MNSISQRHFTRVSRQRGSYSARYVSVAHTEFGIGKAKRSTSAGPAPKELGLSNRQIAPGFMPLAPMNKVCGERVPDGFKPGSNIPLNISVV